MYVRHEPFSFASANAVRKPPVIVMAQRTHGKLRESYGLRARRVMLLEIGELIRVDDVVNRLNLIAHNGEDHHGE
jgi:hypothetical protein